MFAYRLAAHLGQPNVDKMLAEMSEAQFREWQSYWYIERLDPNTQLIAYLISMFHAAHAKKGKLLSVSDLIGETYHQRRVQEAEEIRHRLNMFFGTNY